MFWLMMGAFISVGLHWQARSRSKVGRRSVTSAWWSKTWITLARSLQTAIKEAAQSFLLNTPLQKVSGHLYWFCC